MGQPAYNRINCIQRSFKKSFSINMINSQDCLIDKKILESSSLIHNKVEYAKSQLALNQSQKVLSKNLQILNTNYNKQQIISIVKYYKIDQFKFNLTNFIMQNCISNTKLENNQVTFDQVMIYIECQLCNLQEVQIQRGYGFPEMTIFNSELLEIKNFQFSQSKIFFKSIASTRDCVKNLLLQNYISFYMQVNIKALLLTIQIFKTVQVSIYLYNFKRNNQVQDYQFSSNLLIISTTNKITALIFLESKQKEFIQLINTNFSYNHLNQYFLNLSPISSTKLLLSLNMEIQLYKDINFMKIWQQTQLIQYYILIHKSYIGNGMIISNLIIFENIKVDFSIPIFGAGFYVITTGISFIKITSSEFSNTKTTLQSLYFSKGGCFYIVAGQSALTLNIKSVTFDSSFSRYDGGEIYINPSEIHNMIEFEKLIVKDCFRLIISFLIIFYPKKILYTLRMFLKIQISIQHKKDWKITIRIQIVQLMMMFSIFFNQILQFFLIWKFQYIQLQLLINKYKFIYCVGNSNQKYKLRKLCVQILRLLISQQDFTSNLIKLKIIQQQYYFLQNILEIYIFDLQITQVNQFKKKEERDGLFMNTGFLFQLDCPLNLTNKY
ncbi:unnamed protein product [Paramecium pentaurelia]|uniref:Transmembrane protein n=1 Tax=Paramecium pentaurelia TaxID=43138 RepID=A0A8S1Y8C7_9CILI|nr:unnamed protein product [Paramecium pentaurelia]